MIGQLDRKAFVNGIIAAMVLCAAIYIGSGKLRHFDPALIAYTSATIFATVGIVYRYSVWLQKPPTRMYWRRGWQIFLNPSRFVGNVGLLARLFLRNFVAQVFIDRRSHLRWVAHFLMSWGCIVAVMVTFSLVFGWVHFESDPRDPLAYRAFLFGIHAGTFPAASPVGWITFHILDFCAVAIIIGMAFAFKRRMYDKGAISVQTFSMDFLPLVLLAAVSITGLMLTVSAMWMHGHSYSFIALIHAFSVILTLLYMPFGKFFHIFQRPAGLGVHFYKRQGQEGNQGICSACGLEFASALQVSDLQIVLAELKIDQSTDDGGHYQNVCPACRRKSVALAQMAAIGGEGFI